VEHPPEAIIWALHCKLLFFNNKNNSENVPNVSVAGILFLINNLTLATCNARMSVFGCVRGCACGHAGARAHARVYT
jgi:hypothetical protein